MDALMENMREQTAMERIYKEIRRAKEKYPHFADDLFQAVSLLGEEFGETSMAVNDHCFDGKSIDDVITEAAQMSAMGFRMICLALEIKERRYDCSC